MWLIEFLFGMFLAYLILSPRLRHFLFMRDRTQSIESRVAAEEGRIRYQTSQPPAKPIAITVSHDESSTPVGTYGKAVVGEDEVVKWLRKNPELRNINGIKD